MVSYSGYAGGSNGWVTGGGIPPAPELGSLIPGQSTYNYSSYQEVPQAAQGFLRGSEALFGDAGQWGGPGAWANYGYDPSQIAGYGRNVAGQAEQIPGLIQALFRSGFDPQQELYGQFSQGVTDRARTALAGSGLANTPYGLGVQNDNQTRSELAWGDRQLGRQIGAGDAIGKLLGQYGNAYQTAAGIQQQPAQLELQRAGVSQQGQQIQNEVLRNWLSYLGQSQQQEQNQAQAVNDAAQTNLDRALFNQRLRQNFVNSPGAKFYIQDQYGTPTGFASGTSGG